MPDRPQAPAHLPDQSELLNKTQGSKNIVICCDGTGNQFGYTNSNVVKLYTALAIDDNQVGYYHPGVGTMGDPGERQRILRWWSQLKGLAFAAGFKDNVFDAYRYLMAVYNDGDRVYFFGFSRGAYTVRALAGLLDGYGLLCNGNQGHLPYAWRLYADQHADRKRHSINEKDHFAAAFKETFSRKDFTIQFLGIWDTVSSIGWISSPLRLFNVAQNATIRRGRHAISIDERRCFYHDNLWGKPFSNQDLAQVWFAGVHSDIGGSYSQQSSGLSNITLEWMLHEARDAGVRLVEDRVDLVLGRHSKSYPDAKPLFEKPSSSVVHKSLKLPWWILEIFPHVYYDKDYAQELYRIPLGARRQLPDGALLHHSVKQRIDDKAARYHPRNVTRGTLTPVTGPGNQFGHQPLLYKYKQPEAHAKTNSFSRWALIVLFMAFHLTVVFCALLLATKWGPRVAHSFCHLWQISLHWVLKGYSGLSGWVMKHLPAHLHSVFF